MGPVGVGRSMNSESSMVMGGLGEGRWGRKEEKGEGDDEKHERHESRKGEIEAEESPRITRMDANPEEKMEAELTGGDEMGEEGAEEGAGVSAGPEEDEVERGAGGKGGDDTWRAVVGERRRIRADAESGGDEPDQCGEIAGGVVDGGAGAVFAAGAQENLAVVGVGLGADEEDGGTVEQAPRNAAALGPRVGGRECEKLGVALDEMVAEPGLARSGRLKAASSSPASSRR